MTIETAGSFNRVNYLLRPSKQVERKLIVEALHRLGTQGYNIPDYRYVGFGSVYYADFILFHKYLYISDMLCVENKDIERRMRFNKPYDFVDLFMGQISHVFPEINRQQQHLIWLDYDGPLDGDMLRDCASALAVLAPGSLLLTTVTAQLSQVERAANIEEMRTRSERLSGEYNEAFGHLIAEPVKPPMLSRKQLPTLFSRVLRKQFIESTRSRTDIRVDFQQIFNYRYSDGATMLTFGGLVDTPERIEQLRQSDFLNGAYAATEEEPLVVSVPHLTVREKHWLDQHLDASRREPESLEFELDQEALDNYCRYYRYYPTYYETLV